MAGCLLLRAARYSAGIHSFGLPSSSDRKSVPRNHRWAETGPAQSTESVDWPARQKSARADPRCAHFRIQNQAAQPNNAPHRWNQRTRASVRAQQRSREPPRTTNSQRAPSSGLNKHVSRCGPRTTQNHGRQPRTRASPEEAAFRSRLSGGDSGRPGGARALYGARTRRARRGRRELRAGALERCGFTGGPSPSPRSLGRRRRPSPRAATAASVERPRLLSHGAQTVHVGRCFTKRADSRDC